MDSERAGTLGIVLLTKQSTPIGVQIRALERLRALFSADEMRDRLVFLLNHA